MATRRLVGRVCCSSECVCEEHVLNGGARRQSMFEVKARLEASIKLTYMSFHVIAESRHVKLSK
jgi:hypothetical protein